MENKRTFTLIGRDGKPYASRRPGRLGGHRGTRIYGRLDCPAASRAIARGGYVPNRVFFLNENHARAAGYRPCAVCLPERYKAMKSSIQFSTGQSTLGPFLVARNERGVCAILLGSNCERELRARFPRADVVEARVQLAPLVSQVAAFVAEPARGLDVDLDMQGTEFQRRVWQALRQIPAGSTESYGEVARRIGAPATAKEVGEACAANLLAVVVPCHRVVRRDGGLAGYRWGVARKRALLAAERA